MPLPGGHLSIKDIKVQSQVGHLYHSLYSGDLIEDSSCQSQGMQYRS
jgi:hypothetical protein